MRFPASLGAPDDHTREVLVALDHAKSGAERIRDIVRGLKTFSRPENETMAPLDVGQVVEAALAMVKNEIRHRAKLVKDVARVPEVVANEARLGQVVLNLLMNAIQALPEDRGETNEIRVVVRAMEQDRVAIEVGDNGVGIAPQVRGRIFEPFFTTKPVGIGTGLGLAICHGIVTGFGGTLDVESELGKGSVFRVELPAASRTMEATAAAHAKEGPSVAPKPSTRGRILVIDDEPIVSFSLERLLSSEGDVVAATSAKEALGRIEKGERFDVILCDLMMPGMDGQAMHAALAKLAPDQAEHMIFVTGGAFTTRARDFLESVPNPRLSKPFDVDALFGLVRERLH